MGLRYSKWNRLLLKVRTSETIHALQLGATSQAPSGKIGSNGSLLNTALGVSEDCSAWVCPGLSPCGSAFPLFNTIRVKADRDHHDLLSDLLNHLACVESQTESTSWLVSLPHAKGWQPSWRDQIHIDCRDSSDLELYSAPNRLTSMPISSWLFERRQFI